MDELKCSEAYSTAKNIIRASINDTKQNFIYIGHYLKEIRDAKLYQEDGYVDFDTFMATEIGKDKGWASRCINVASQFGIVENGQPTLAEEYQEYSLSLLIEMVAMTPEQRELVNPDTEVKQAREIKKAGKEKSCESQLPEPEPEEWSEAQKPFQRGCITGKSRYGLCGCCGNGGVQCCGQCDESCNSRCGWLNDPWTGEPDPEQAPSEKVKPEWVNPEEEQLDESYSFAGVKRASERWNLTLAIKFVRDRFQQLVSGRAVIPDNDKIIEQFKQYSRLNSDKIAVDAGVEAYATYETVEYYRGDEDMGICLYERFANIVRKQMDEYIQEQAAAEKERKNTLSPCPHNPECCSCTLSDEEKKDYRRRHQLQRSVLPGVRLPRVL